MISLVTSDMIAECYFQAIEFNQEIYFENLLEQMKSTEVK